MGQQFSGLPMGALIGGPLKSAAEANQQMAMTQLMFMMDTCFTQDANDKSKYEPVMISMTLKRSVVQPSSTEGQAPTIQQTSTAFELPILTIIPLNSLAVDDVSVKFEMEVKSSYAQDNSTTESSSTAMKADLTASAKIGPFKVEVHGSVSHNSSSENKSDTHYSQSNSARYEVSVHAGQLPLPQGVKTIIDAYAKNVSPIVLPTTTPTPTPPPAG
ncbi:DUF2589 domain-containing protein [Sulfurimonas sp. HSL3-2]|uniref:DUF2589 domain-containing protein n=1 Tax=Hydrocurvibacter mobilis TaxID=3131936 RepID=UPI0031F8CE5E